MYEACEGLSDLGHGPNQPTASIIGEFQCLIPSWDISVYVACEGLSDLGHEPNQPTATIIGGYSASLQDVALIFTLVRV